MKLKIALLQFYTEKLQDALPLFEDAARRDADVVLAPERWMSMTGENIITDDSPFLKQLSKIAEENSCNLVSGALMEREGRKVFVSAYVLGRKGGILEKYRKTHLFEAESKIFSPGDRPHVFALDRLNASVIICYDLDFPEIVRRCAAEGCDVLLVPSRITAAGTRPWRLYATVRALENRLPIAYANVSDGGKFQGGSTVIDFEFAEEAPIIYPRIRGMGAKRTCSVFNIEPENFRKERRKRLEQRSPEEKRMSG
ncbi:MAG: carbon-nitrogen hydrolase family protein [Methanomassiliicoccales archaeon]